MPVRRYSTPSRMSCSRSASDIFGSKCSTFHQPTLSSMNGGGGFMLPPSPVSGTIASGVTRARTGPTPAGIVTKPAFSMAAR